MGNRVFLLQKRDGPLKRLFWNDGSSFQPTGRVGKEQRRLESLQRDLFLNNISCSIFVKVSIVLWIGRSDQIFSLYPTLCEATFFVVEKKKHDKLKNQRAEWLKCSRMNWQKKNFAFQVEIEASLRQSTLHTGSVKEGKRWRKLHLHFFIIIIIITSNIFMLFAILKGNDQRKLTSNRDRRSVTRLLFRLAHCRGSLNLLYPRDC